MGVSAAAFMLVIAVTGILLNHTVEFGFDHKYIQSGRVLDWYGIEASDELISFPAGSHRITLTGRHLYLDQTQIKGEYHDLTGAVWLNELLVIAAADNLLLLTHQGELIERLRPGDSIPQDIRRLGIDTGGRVVVQSDHALYQPGDDFIRWLRWNRDASTVAWSTPDAVPAELGSALRKQFRGGILPVERVLLDLHSGRFFGRLGPWLFDSAAVLLILLSLSGSWIWLKSRR